MRNTAKLAFDMLEKEMDVMSFDETFEIVGGVMITTTEPTPEELWAFQHLVDAVFGKLNAIGAQNPSQNTPGQRNGLGDAFRHSYWMAMNGRDMGRNNAISLGIAHEDTGGGPMNERVMDLNNNSWGANFGTNNSNFSYSQFVNAFNSAVASGNIIILDKSYGNSLYSAYTEDPNNYTTTQDHTHYTTTY